MKCDRLQQMELREGRTPRGVRGLKFGSDLLVPRPLPSHPARGAWIEIRIW